MIHSDHLDRYSEEGPDFRHVKISLQICSCIKPPALFGKVAFRKLNRDGLFFVR
jgi:hypothetical protein